MVSDALEGFVNPFASQSSSPASAQMDRVLDSSSNDSPASFPDQLRDILCRMRQGDPNASESSTPSQTPHLSRLSSGASTPSTIPAATIQIVNIRTHVPIILDMVDSNYSQWQRFFETVFTKFGLRCHIKVGPPPRNTDAEWVMNDASIVNWFYTIVTPRPTGVRHAAI